MTVPDTAHSAAIAPLFLAHGSPMLAITDIPANRFLRSLAGTMPEVKGIVILSPHWETEGQKISAPGALKTIHDFGAFPQALFDIQYPAQASADLVRRVAQLLQTAKIPAEEDGSWGLDHGAWVPLSLAYPDPSVPVVELSLPYDSTPESVHALGRSLAPLSEQGILIIGSGSTTHNLRELFPEGTDPAPWAIRFDQWLEEGLNRGKIEWFSDLNAGPEFRRAHPTEEHLLPLFFAMGASGREAAPELLHRSYSHGTISMSYYRFPSAEAA